MILLTFPAEDLNLQKADKLVFIDHHSSVIKHPDTETSFKPDIGAIIQSHLDTISGDHLGPKTKSHAWDWKQRHHQSYCHFPWHIFDFLVKLKPHWDVAGPHHLLVKGYLTAGSHLTEI